MEKNDQEFKLADDNSAPISVYNQNIVVEEEGAKILKKNKFFSDLTKIMKNIPFREFYNEYFKDWSDVQVMIFYMKLYSVLEAEYYNRFSDNITDEIMAWTLYKIMENTSTRKTALQLFKNYKGDALELEAPETTVFRKQIQFKP